MNERSVASLLRERYGIKMSAAACLVHNDKREVWQVRADARWFALKFTRTSSDFAVLLQRQLAAVGLSPAVVPASDGQLMVKKEEGFYFLSVWMNGSITSDPIRYVEALARFHAHACVPNTVEEAAVPKGPLNQRQWLRALERRLDDLRRWREEVRSYALLAAFDFAIRLAEGVCERIEAMDLTAYCAEAARRRTIVHGDYHRGNLLMTEAGPMVLDLDSAYMAIQVCDWHRATTDLLDKMSVAPDAFRPLLHRYYTLYPEAVAYAAVYEEACRFPHYFWALALRAQLAGPIGQAADRLCAAAAAEQVKDRSFTH